IQNFGGIGTVNVYGVRMNFQNGGNVSYNVIDNSANGGVVSTDTFYGVLFANGTNASGTVNNNTFTVSQGQNNNTVAGVQTTLAGTGTTTINGNTVNFSLTAMSGVPLSGNRFLLQNTGATGTLNMSGNTVNCALSITTAGSNLSGSTYGVHNTGGVTGSASLTNNTVSFMLANTSTSNLSSFCSGVLSTATVPGDVLLNNNSVSYQLTNTDASGTLSSGTYAIDNGGPVSGSLTMSGNTTSYTVPAAPASVGSISGFSIGAINFSAVTGNLNMSNNTSMFSVTNGGATIAGGSLTGVTNSNAAVGGTASFNGNTVGFALATTAGTISHGLAGVTNSGALTGAATMSNNTLTYTGTNPGGTFSTGVTCIGQTGTVGSTLTIDGNTLLNSSTASTGGITFILANAVTTGLLTISNNRYQNSSTASTGTVNFINAGANSNALTVTGNYFTGFSRSGTGNTFGYNASGGSATGGTHQLVNNYFTNISLAGASQFVGLYSLTSNIQNYTVTGNLIGAPVPGVSGQGISTGAANLVGIWACGAAPANATIANNVVQNLSGAGQVLGLTLTNSTSNPVATTSSLLGGSISGNTISSLSSSGASAVYGMFLLTSTSATAPLNTFANKVNDLAATGTGASMAYGLYVAGGPTHALYTNLVSNLTAPASTSVPAVAGIYSNAGTGAVLSVTYNTVYLGGAGTSSSAALYRAGTGSPTWRNNLFYNARTGGGSNYAIATASTTGFVGSATSPGTNTSDYNLFFTADATKVGLYGATGYSFAGWKTVTGGDGSSLSETTAVVPAASLFTNAAAGDLSLNAANPVAWYANGTGTQVASIGTDYAGTARPTTVAAGAPDVGAFEVTPTSTPPALTASAAPALGGTQAFSLGGRTLAQLRYGSTGTVPTSVVVRYYSGTNPPAPYVATARYANTYFDFSNTGGSGFTYQPTLTYDPALLNTIASEAAQRISQRNASNTGYGTLATAVNPAPVRTLVGPGSLSLFSILAIGDGEAPLPVELTRFQVVREGEMARLSWATASEKNSAYFEVERSTDGVAFAPLGRVAAQGSSTQAHAYAFTDDQLARTGAALAYYRLRQVDADGTATYSPVRTIAQVPNARLALFPNPTTGAALLTGTAPGLVVWVFDALGREVARATADAAGTAALVLPQHLPPGVYMVRSGSKVPLRLLLK
ncbi:MAG: hypothetical protein M3Y54_04125, partial [Bacteroidota bacterium]|nr:hypothetical protein [Bacteroidota bacterium]